MASVNHNKPVTQVVAAENQSDKLMYTPTKTIITRPVDKLVKTDGLLLLKIEGIRATIKISEPMAKMKSCT